MQYYDADTWTRRVARCGRGESSSVEAARKVEMESTSKATSTDPKALGKGRETKRKRDRRRESHTPSYDSKARISTVG